MIATILFRSHPITRNDAISVVVLLAVVFGFKYVNNLMKSTDTDDEKK
jgi:hypothetical protein